MNQQQQQPPQPFTVQGYRGMLTVTPASVIIARKRGYKEIRIHEITGITFLRSGMFSRGCIRFSYRGGTETKYGLKQFTDEDALWFKPKQERGILQAKEMIEYYQRMYTHQFQMGRPFP